MRPHTHPSLQGNAGDNCDPHITGSSRNSPGRDSGRAWCGRPDRRRFRAGPRAADPDPDRYRAGHRRGARGWVPAGFRRPGTHIFAGFTIPIADEIRFAGWFSGQPDEIETPRTRVLGACADVYWAWPYALGSVRLGPRVARVREFRDAYPVNMSDFGLGVVAGSRIILRPRVSLEPASA